MSFFKKVSSIYDKTYISDKVSKKSKIILNKDINYLSLDELSHLLREGIGTQVCINISLSKLVDLKIDYDFFFNNNDSESQRELLRELVLLEDEDWDINSNSFFKLKNILEENISALKLPTKITERFIDYMPKKINWDVEVKNKFDFFMGDSRTGVFYAYSMIINLKKAILNRVPIYYNIKEEKKIINTLFEFEENILNHINPNEELMMFLNKENW